MLGVAETMYDPREQQAGECRTLGKRTEPVPVPIDTIDSLRAENYAWGVLVRAMRADLDALAVVVAKLTIERDEARALGRIA
jgi:hypothetical protein